MFCLTSLINILSNQRRTSGPSSVSARYTAIRPISTAAASWSNPAAMCWMLVLASAQLWNKNSSNRSALHSFYHHRASMSSYHSYHHKLQCLVTFLTIAGTKDSRMFIPLAPNIYVEWYYYHRAQMSMLSDYPHYLHHRAQMCTLRDHPHYLYHRAQMSMLSDHPHYLYHRAQMSLTHSHYLYHRAQMSLSHPHYLYHRAQMSLTHPNYTIELKCVHWGTILTNYTIELKCLCWVTILTTYTIEPKCL